jgi:hypothetical protein
VKLNSQSHSDLRTEQKRRRQQVKGSHEQPCQLSPALPVSGPLVLKAEHKVGPQVPSTQPEEKSDIVTTSPRVQTVTQGPTPLSTLSFPQAAVGVWQRATTDHLVVGQRPEVVARKPETRGRSPWPNPSTTWPKPPPANC